MAETVPYQHEFMAVAAGQFQDLGFGHDEYRYDPQTLIHKISLGEQYIHFGFYETYRKGWATRILADVGISVDALETLLADLEGHPYGADEQRAGTIGVDLGILSNGKRGEKIIYSSAGVPEIVKEYRRDFELDGLPHLRQFDSLDKILVALSNMKQDRKVEPLQSPLDHVRASKAVVASFLLNDRQQFEAVVDRELAFISAKGQIDYDKLGSLVDKLREIGLRNNLFN